MIARPHWFNRPLAISENTVLLFLAVIVGLFTGISVWVFRESFHYLEFFLREQNQGGILGPFFASINMDPRFGLVMVLFSVGLVVGWLMGKFVGHEPYHGVAGIMTSVLLAGGHLPYWKMPFKALASALSLGAGASTGPEDPSVQIGANLGSFLGQKLHLSEEYTCLLVAAGAASAIAAAFNAPIAGVFFALEIILGEFTSRSFGIVVLSAVISAAFTQAVRGMTPVFDGLSYQLGSPIELPFYVILGLGLGIFAAYAVRYFNWQSRQWKKLLQMPLPMQTALTGALVGLVGIYFPQIMGPGEATMHNVLTGHSDFTVLMLAALAIVKLVMTAISLGGGFVGGVFAPTLFIGIMLGGAYGEVLQRLFPGIVDDPNTFAIAGMAGLLGGVLRAPITAILMVFELTDEYLLILPIMLTTMICVYVVELRGIPGLYAFNLKQHGIHLRQGRDVDVMQGVMVREAMTCPAPCIRPSASLTEMRDTMRKEHTRSLCVVDDENILVGVATMSDLQRAYDQLASNPQPAEQLTVGDICTREVVVTHPNDVLWTAIRAMGAREVGRLPVVDETTGKVIGMLRRHNIVDAYNMAIARKLQDQHNAEQIRLNTLTGAHVLEYHIKQGAPIVGLRIRDVHWPAEAVVASIQRQGKLIVPHGNSGLRTSDILTIVADPEAESQLETLFGYNPRTTNHL